MGRRVESVSYEEFKQRVRRYRRSDLLRLCAQLNADLLLERKDLKDKVDRPNYVQPYTVAGVARTALVSANEYRSAVADLHDLGRLCGYYVHVDDPPNSTDTDTDHLRQMMARSAYEQFPRQLSPMEEIGRSLALFDGPLSEASGLPTADDWRDAFGATVHDLAQIAFVVTAAASRHGGVVPMEHMSDDRFVDAYEELTPSAALEVMLEFYGSTVAEAAAWGRREEVPIYEKWSPSPLDASPIIQLDDGTYVVPDPDAISRRFSPGGLFYPAIKAFGSSFPTSLGPAFESYIGSQLKLLEAATVTGEREYHEGKKRKDTCDWFVVTDECVVIVEVKAKRPALEVRVGSPAGLDEIKAKLGEAADQLDRTARMILEKHPAVSDIPADVPLYGLIVTLEPFFWVDAVSYDDVLANRSVPLCVAYSHQIEGVVAALAARTDAGARLARVFESMTNAFGIAGPQIPDSIEDLADVPANPILSEVWEPLQSGVATRRARRSDSTALGPTSPPVSE